MSLSTYCTYSVSGSAYVSHSRVFVCRTCSLDNSHGDKGICEACLFICHQGHDVTGPVYHEKFFCDCGAAAGCKALDPNPNNPKKQAFLNQNLIKEVSSIAHNQAQKERAHLCGLSIVHYSWNDNSRFNNSAYGKNISDMTLTLKEDRTLLPAIRFPNFSDLTCDMAAGNLKVMIGNETQTTPESVLLEEYIKTRIVNEKGTVITNLWDDTRDSVILTRGQTCILPLSAGECTFYPSIFNYQTRPKDPAVLVILSTSQGTSTQAIVSANQALKFNNQGLAHSFVAQRLKEERRAKGLPEEGPMTKEEMERNVIFIYSIPLQQAPSGNRGGGGGSFGGFGGSPYLSAPSAGTFSYSAKSSNPPSSFSSLYPGPSSNSNFFESNKGSYSLSSANIDYGQAACAAALSVGDDDAYDIDECATECSVGDDMDGCLESTVSFQSKRSANRDRDRDRSTNKPKPLGIDHAMLRITKESEGEFPKLQVGLKRDKTAPITLLIQRYQATDVIDIPLDVYKEIRSSQDRTYSKAAVQGSLVIDSPQDIAKRVTAPTPHVNGVNGMSDIL